MRSKGAPFVGHAARRQGSSADDPKLRLASRYVAGGKSIGHSIDGIRIKSGTSKKVIFIQWLSVVIGTREGRGKDGFKKARQRWSCIYDTVTAT